MNEHSCMGCNVGLQYSSSGAEKVAFYSKYLTTTMNAVAVDFPFLFANQEIWEICLLNVATASC